MGCRVAGQESESNDEAGLRWLQPPRQLLGSFWRFLGVFLDLRLIQGLGV